MNYKPEDLTGVLIATPTFLDDNYNLELGRIREHYRRLMKEGVTKGNGVIKANAGISEGEFLNDEQWYRIMEALADESEGKDVTTALGIFDINAKDAAEKAEKAAESGIDFVQVAPPHYKSPSDKEVVDHFTRICESADIGVFAYNTPWAMPDGYEISFSVLNELKEVENFIGVKWFSFDPWNYYRCLFELSDELIFIDNRAIKLAENYKFGLNGFVDYPGNVMPELSLKLWNLLDEGRYEEYNEIYTELVAKSLVLREGPEGWSTMGEAGSIKKILSAFGLDCGPPFPAQDSWPETEVEKMRNHIEETGLSEWAMDLNY